MFLNNSPTWLSIWICVIYDLRSHVLVRSVDSNEHRCNHKFLPVLHIWGINNTSIIIYFTRKCNLFWKTAKLSFLPRQRGKCNCRTTKASKPSKWLQCNLSLHIWGLRTKILFLLSTPLSNITRCWNIVLFSTPLSNIISMFIRNLWQRWSIFFPSYTYFEVQHNFPKTYFIVFLSDKP